MAWPVDVRACAAACGAEAHAAAPVLRACADGTESHIPTIFAAAAPLLCASPAVAEAVAVAFRPFLLELITRLAPEADAVHALGALLGAFEEAYPLIEAHLQRHYAQGLPTDTTGRLQTRLRLLRAAPHLADDLEWHAAPLHDLVRDANRSPTDRLLALECYAIQAPLSSAAKAAAQTAWIGDVPAPLDVDGTMIDVRALPVHEQARLDRLWHACAAPLPPTPFPLHVTAADVSPPLTLIGSFLWPARGIVPPTPFVLTPGASDALHDVLLHLSLRLPLVLRGPAASGKTHLLYALAHQCAARTDGLPPCLSIPLGDQSGVDAKALLGSYVSSRERPGSFSFVEGALTRAVRAGLWVVLEDIDKASSEVLSVIAPLAEALGPTKAIGARPVLDLGAHGRVVAARGFALLATRTVRANAPAAQFLSSEHWGEVALPPPQASDVQAILDGRFPRVSALPPEERACLVRAWEGAVLASRGAPGSVRHATLRELMQWCARIEARDVTSLFSNPTVQEAVFLDACDVFLASFPSETPLFHAVVRAIGEALQLSDERQTYAWHARVPDMALGQAGCVRVGRITLERVVPGTPAPQRYALTRPALVGLERLAACVAHAEPALLVGETGTGKTTMVQVLAQLLGQPLTVVNMSQQTESGDLLGAYRPLDPRAQAADVHNVWTRVFEQTFSVRRNTAYLDAERRAFQQGRWARLARLWTESCTRAQRELAQGDRKRARTDGTLEAAWAALAARAEEFAALYAAPRRPLALGFVEGPLVRAVREGHWLLLDEINLASPETLDCLAPLLQARDASLVLTERGDLTPIPRHPHFRLFACMNPATDVGKRDLVPSVRTRFTELYVPSPDADREALVHIVQKYIGGEAVGDQAAVLDVAEWYVAVRHLAAQHELADGANQRPHYSVRTLARALTFASALAPAYGLRRALAEGVCMAFGMLLDAPSAARLQQCTTAHLLARARDVRVRVGYVPPRPGDDYVQIGAFWLATGPLAPDTEASYVLTPSVEAKVHALARALVTRQSPVLIQGPTSAGKTSAVAYLARRTGHRFVRINNHEHTDVQEYLGSYATNAEGQLVWTEGLLVTALRRGDWLVLDELNLAPTDVLEALNRLLDDNRELRLPETGEVVRPHPHFMLFATQNPPGAYAGRKVLSRAFRNRFVEVHFDEVPPGELATILTQRCAIAPSYAAQMVAVFGELQRRRESERVFERHAFATLRDLFRWGSRSAVGYEQLADTGYMLLAERTRHPRDRATVQAVLEEVLRVRISVDTLYDGGGTLAAQIGATRLQQLRDAAAQHGLVWTSALRRLVCLAAVAVHYEEPVLLVGETGAGKTSVCDVLATAFGCALHSVSCHQNTDSADLLGGQRPLRDRAARTAAARVAAAAVLGQAEAAQAPLDELAARLTVAAPSDAQASALREVQAAQALFEWCDGPLVEAMRRGEHLLLDEISLADDSVLERLNSVLEPERTLVLAEKAGVDVVVQGARGFHVLATMNPGGDYGKKELSPALRNRFTEVYVPPVDDEADQIAIVQALLPPTLHPWAAKMLEFVRFLAHKLGGTEHTGLGVRDLVGWARFVREVTERGLLPPPLAFAHGAALTVIDALGALPATAAMPPARVQALRAQCYAAVHAAIAPAHFDPTEASLYVVHETATSWGMGPFSIAKGPHPPTAPSFSLAAPTTAANALRVLRALAVRGRSVLLEGSPGAGKTSLVATLAALTGHELVRINVSEQTELVDLFGAELPVEHGRPGEFAWRPAAFLDAMQRGAWVLLDEMNLASQAVLEGLNSCLDHRGAVYIAEMGRTFTKHPDFLLFAAQNPQHQGGARKGLPKSLLNRFVHVYVAELQADDVHTICTHMYPALRPHLDAMVAFNDALQRATQAQTIGRHGAPWEFNLRDLLRWLHVLEQAPAVAAAGAPPPDPLAALSYLYLARFRTAVDRQAAARLFEQCFSCSAAPALAAPPALLAPTRALLGRAPMNRAPAAAHHARWALVPSQLTCLEGMAMSVRLGLLTIVTGSAGAGKSSVVHLLASLTGHPLESVRLSAASDTSDLLGSFEQSDPAHRIRAAARALAPLLAALHARAAAAVDTTGGDLLSAVERVRAELETRPELARTLAPYLQGDERAALEAALAPLAEDATQGGHFAWVDGPLVRAARAGHWLLLEHANLCAASVLDRLNSLFEPQGGLVLSERGLVDGHVPRLVPHPAFRVFMTVDPRHGELSRAMRNRGMELWLDPCPSAPLAPLVRAPAGLSGSLVTQAVQAHRLRRGASELLVPATPQRAAQAQLGVEDCASPDAAFVVACMQKPAWREAALVYAAQALAAPARTLVERMGWSLPPTTDAYAALPVGADLAPPDVRRIPALAPWHNARTALALALPVRAALCAELVSAWTARTEWVQGPPSAARDGLHHLPALLTACVHMARVEPPTERAAVLLETLLDHVRFICEGCDETTPDYARVRMVGRGVQGVLRALSNEGLTPPADLEAALHRLVVPHSQRGAVMQRLWHQALPPVPPEAWALFAPLEAYASEILSSASAITALEVLATLHLWTDAWPEAQVQSVRATVEALVQIEAPAPRPPWPYVARVVPVVLWTLLHDAAGAPLAPRLRMVLRMAAEHGVAPPATLVGAQLRAWSPAHVLSPSQRLGAARALWYVDGAWSVDAPGAHAWTSAVLLPAVLDAVHGERLPLSEAEAHDEHVRALAQVVAAAMPHAQMPRLRSVQEALYACAWLVCTALHETIASLAQPALQSIEAQLAEALASSQMERFGDGLANAVPRLADTPLAPLVEAWHAWLQACLHAAPSAASLAPLWVRLGLWTLQAYVPDVPLDPVAEAHAHSAYASVVHERLARQYEVESAAEEVRTGGSEHVVLWGLRTAMAELTETQRRACSTRVQRPPNAARLARMHAEWATLTNHLLETQRVERLLTRLLDGVDGAVAEETALQSALAAWDARMRRQYADLGDLARPVLMAIEQVRLGLRLARHTTTAMAARMTRCWADATRFPRAAAAQAVMASAEPRAMTTAVPELLLALASAAHDAVITSRRVHVRAIYDALLVLWAQQREAEREAAEKAAQLFVYQGEDEASDEQARLEAEMRAHFPVYDGVLDEEAKPGRTDAPALRLRDETVLLVHDLHTLLHPPTLTLPVVRRLNPVADLWTQQCDELVRCTAVHAALPAELDGAAAYMLARLQRSTAPRAPNFYHDAQPAELARMAPLLARLRSRVSELLHEWPEQMQLGQLAERCARVAALDRASPVAKALAAVEQLLTHLDDWETYASRATSLQAHAAELTALVVEWRRQELHSWSSLLDDEAAKEEARVAPWFFTLYEATTRAGTEALRKELVALLDAYVRESTAGQLSARLRLLDTLSVCLQADDASTSRLLHHMAAYFAQFVPAMEAQLASQRTRLERQMADYVRLASWRDVNVYALRQSAQKTHAYLHKILRQFREVLQQPADPMLALHAEARPSVAVRALAGPADVRVDVLQGAQPPDEVSSGMDAPRAPHMQASDRTVARLRALCTQTLQPALTSAMTASVVDLGTTILATSDELMQQTPALATAAHAKLLKSLASQKRRAWADLLQALRRLGLSPFLTPERHAHNHDPARVYGVCALPAHEGLGTEAIHAYHTSMLACLARLRLAAQTPNGDVPDLPRGVALVEHAVFLALQVRERLGSMLEGAVRIWALAQRLCALRGPLQPLTATERATVASRVDALARLSDALVQLATEALRAVEASPLGGDVPWADLERWTERVREAHQRLAAVCATWDVVPVGLLTLSEIETVRASEQVLVEVHDALRALGETVPAVQVLTMPLCAWLAEVCTPLCLPNVPDAGPALQAASDRVCSAVLVIVQALPSSAPADDLSLLDEAERLYALDRMLRPHQLADLIGEALALAGSGVGTPGCLGEMARFVVPYAELLGTHLASVSLWYRSLMRLCVILCVIITSLAQKGFCQPPEDDGAEQDNDGEGGDVLEGGTGLGDGTGAKDVSDTLQDDEPMEELQNEDGPAEPGESQGEDKARDMDDMDGDVHSVDGEQDAQETEDQEEKEVEDEVGDVDPLDPEAVDEKMWGADPPQETQGESEAQGAAGDDREQAGERQEAEPTEDGKAEAEGDDEADEAEAEAEGEETEPTLEDIPDRNEGLGRELDQEAHEEEMQLGELDMPEEASGDEDDASGDVSLDDAEAAEDAWDNDTPNDLEGESHEDAQPEPVAEPKDEEHGGEPDASMNEEQVEDEHANDEQGEGERAEDAHAEDQQTEDEPAEDDAPQSGKAMDSRQVPVPQAMPSQALGAMSDEAMDLETTHEGGGEDAGGAAGAQERARGDGDDMDGTSAVQGGGAPQAEPASGGAGGEDEARPNPVQSLGDALEQFRRDVERIREASQQDASSSRDDGVPEASDMEHVAQDEEADAQALGVADEQQAQAMKNLSVSDAEQGDSTMLPDMAEEPAGNDEPRAVTEPDTAEVSAAHAHGERDGALAAADVRTSTEADEGDVPAEPIERLDDEARAEAEAQVLHELENFRASEADETRAAELWRSYSALTMDLAFSLCEQLRLILAPTLATRLNGDYRTGKRLNMRKIIPFIASDFAKDKIWLRRTKPSAREYQVLLAIDDSKSMADSQNIHLAYQTLTLVANALTRLEVGDIGLCRFGASMEMLHEFGSTAFSDRHGGQILSQLQFQQTSTDMHALLTQCMDVLRDARQRHASVSAADLWQLAIVISDGVCQDHARLKALLRRATEERIMIVFVVVDAGADGTEPAPGQAPRSSILSMNQVSYHTDAAGKLQLDMKRYIDTFPFEYYVIVRDVQSLPHVLTTTLRQWAERIRDA